jgi:cytochrome c553
MNIRFLMGVAAVCCAFALEAPMVPGEPAPDVVVRDASGTAVRLSTYRQKKHVALLAVPPGRAAADWADTERRLAALDTVALFESGPAATVLIDPAGVVRRILTGRVLSGAELGHFVELWQSGKRSFAAYCARCHGEEGDSTLCVDNALTGVGQRLSPEEIRAKLNIGELNDRQVLIREMRIPRDELEGIIVYVKSL